MCVAAVPGWHGARGGCVAHAHTRGCVYVCEREHKLPPTTAPTSAVARRASTSSRSLLSSSTGARTICGGALGVTYRRACARAPQAASKPRIAGPPHRRAAGAGAVRLRVPAAARAARVAARRRGGGQRRGTGWILPAHAAAQTHARTPPVSGRPCLYPPSRRGARRQTDSRARSPAGNGAPASTTPTEYTARMSPRLSPWAAGRGSHAEYRVLLRYYTECTPCSLETETTCGRGTRTAE